jgi:hypothetical protein
VVGLIGVHGARGLLGVLGTREGMKGAFPSPIISLLSTSTTSLFTSLLIAKRAGVWIEGIGAAIPLFVVVRISIKR